MFEGFGRRRREEDGPTLYVKRYIRPYIERDGEFFDAMNGKPITTFERVPTEGWNRKLSLSPYMRPAGPQTYDPWTAKAHKLMYLKPADMAYVAGKLYDPHAEDEILARIFDAPRPSSDDGIPIGGLPSCAVHRDRRPYIGETLFDWTFLVSRGAAIPGPVEPPSRISISEALKKLKNMDAIHLLSVPDSTFVRLSICARVLGCCTKTVRRRAKAKQITLVRDGPMLTGLTAGDLRKLKKLSSAEQTRFPLRQRAERFNQSPQG
jgi:hypothetical protein